MPEAGINYPRRDYMIVFTATLKAKAGNEKRVEAILKAMIPNVQNEKGTTKYILNRSKADPA